MQRLMAVRRGAVAAARSMATAAPPTGEADLAVKVFVDQQRKFRALVEGSKNMSLPPTADAAAVKKFQADYEALRKKVGIMTTDERLARMLKSLRENTPDVRTYLREVATLRTGACIPDSTGSDAALLSALDAVEKAAGGKALLFSDAKGMASFKQAVSALKAKAGLDKVSQADLDAASLAEEYTQVVAGIVTARDTAVADAQARDAAMLAAPVATPGH